VVVSYHLDMRLPAILTILLSLTVLLTLGAVGCGKKKAASPQSTPTATSSADLGISKVKGQYTEALKKAKDWQKNATLTRVYRKFDGTLGPTKPTPLVFAFNSLAAPKETFEVEYIGTDVSERKVAKQAFELQFNPIDVSEWKVDPDTALHLAEDDGGREFRETHLAGYKVLQQLAKIGAHPLQWYVRYDTGDGSKLRYEMYVDADSGAIDFKRQIQR
jgi:hypothetical protein